MARSSAFACGFAACVLLAGCAGLEKQPDPEPASSREPLATIAVTVPRRASPPQASPRPVPSAPSAQPVQPRFAVVLSERGPGYDEVAREIHVLLDEPPVYNLADKSFTPEEIFLAIADSRADAVIAIGVRAAEAGAMLSTVPVVYCQVFNFAVPENARVPVKGVAALPPLALQLEGWKRLTPGLTRLGMITGPGHDRLVDEALEAAAVHDVDIVHRRSRSDRETLYLFRRMAPNLDGFWLFPDNRILSVTVLRELFEHARRHGVQVAAFNPALLELGARLSSTALGADVAARAVAVAERLAAGEDPPDVTPLRDIEIRSRLAPAAGPAPAHSAAAGGSPR